jgi:hypothetical protein
MWDKGKERKSALFRKNRDSGAAYIKKRWKENGMGMREWEEIEQNLTGSGKLKKYKDTQREENRENKEI